MNFSEEQILLLAPDDASRKSGRELARKDKWVSFAADSLAIWGECQGSGSKPYLTQVDISNIAFKCSCPSRKFPCKHGLGLMLLYCKEQTSFTAQPQPAWVTDWIGKRTEKSEKVQETTAKPKDEAAQAKRQQDRSKKVDDGIEELLLWIKDLVRNGLLTVPGKEKAFELMGKRMVDAQAPGLAAVINNFNEINFYKDGWQGILLDKLLYLYLLASSYKNPQTQAGQLYKEVRSLIGFPQNLDEVRTRDGVKDKWIILGRQITEETQLTIERNWLYGTNTQQYALLLQFYIRSQFKGLILPAGNILDAELVFFDPGVSMRVLIKEPFIITPIGLINGYNNWNEVIEKQTSLLAENPFITDFPVVLNCLQPVLFSRQWWLQDTDGYRMKMKIKDEYLWKLLAVSGGVPLQFALVGRDNEYSPLGVWYDHQYLILQ